jgi:hypothetical protein
VTNETRWHPDLLRRFVATPYVFHNSGAARIWIESNDLEIALKIRHSRNPQGEGPEGGRLSYRLIRDWLAPTDGSETFIISNREIRTLHHGRGTILIHDRERSELLGFVSPNVRADDLVSSLIPALIRKWQ